MISSADKKSPRVDRLPAEICSTSGLGNRIARRVFAVVWMILCRPTPVVVFGWRRLVLRAFGAQLGTGARIYPSVRIWAPWNLRMGRHACLAAGVQCYNVGQVSIGAGATVSQRATLCAASHDYNDPAFPVVAAPIRIASGVWVCMEAFVGMGVSVEVGAIVAARAVVVRNVERFTVVAGNPARWIGARDYRALSNIEVES